MIYEKERRYIIPFDDVPSERQVIPAISVDERRGNFVEVDTGFSEEQARREARRCLSCRRCLGCALCWAECKPEAISFEIPDKKHSLEFDEVILTAGQDSAFSTVSKDLGYGVYSNVMTDLQFERMLSPYGPTRGMVLSPLNGDIPMKIAFVQSRPRGGDDHLMSSVILGLNEAILARRTIPELKATLISPISKTLGTDVRENIAKMEWLTIMEAEPLSVKKEDDGDLLVVIFRDEKLDKAETGFDLVMVLTQQRLSETIRNMSEKLGQKVR